MVGSLAIALAALVVGFMCSAAHLPGLTIGAVLVLAIETLANRGRYAEEKLVVRLTLIGPACACALFAVGALKAPFASRLFFAEASPGFAVLLLAAVAVAGVFGRAGERVLRASAGLLRSTAIGATGIAAALVAVAAPRAARYPGTDDGRELFALVATLPPLVSTGESAYDGTTHDVPVAGLHFASTCRRYSCWGDLLAAPTSRPEEMSWRGQVSFDPHDTIEVRRDAEADRWLVVPDPDRLWQFAVYEGPDLHHRRGLAPVDFATRSSPPRGWILGAAFGVLVALGSLVRGARTRRRARRVSEGWPARLDTDGWLRFTDGAPPMALPARPDALGPVVVIFGRPRPGTPYRTAEERVVEEVIRGESTDLLRDLRLQALGHDALALGAVALTGAPLAVSACLGFLG